MNSLNYLPPQPGLNILVMLMQTPVEPILEAAVKGDSSMEAVRKSAVESIKTRTENRYFKAFNNQPRTINELAQIMHIARLGVKRQLVKLEGNEKVVRGELIGKEVLWRWTNQGCADAPIYNDKQQKIIKAKYLAAMTGKGWQPAKVIAATIKAHVSMVRETLKRPYMAGLVEQKREHQAIFWRLK